MQMTMPYRQLTQDQRYQIEAGLRAKESQANIAKRVGVHQSVVRFVATVLKMFTRRFRRPMKVMSCALGPKFCKPLTWLSHHLAIWLKHGMSPEQIAHRLKQEKPDQTVSHELIYRFIASDQRGGGELYTHLRHCRKRYRKRYGSHDRRGGCCEIECRLPSVLRRSKPRERLGDWDGDTVHGVGGNLVTLVERKSGYRHSQIRHTL